VPSYLAITETAPDAWTLGGSILTFAFPMILFVIAATALWVLFTQPDAIPWRAGVSPVRSVSSTLAARDPQPPADRSADGEAGAKAGGQ
jgi:hypothetical protein